MGEASNGRSPGVVEHQAEALGCARGGGVVHVAELSRIGIGGGLVGRRGAGTGRPRGTHLAPGLVPTGCFAIAQFQNFRAVGVRGQAGAAQLVTEQVFHSHVLRDGVFPHRDAGSACIVILRRRATCHFVVVANEVSGPIAIGLQCTLS